MRALSLLGLLLAAAALATMAVPLTGHVVGVTDGDTITVLMADRVQVKVRLTEIDTPESGQPWGSRAKQALSDKVFGKSVEVQSMGTDRYGRTLGKALVDDRDVNREMVREGHAWVYRQYMKDESLLADEAYAKGNGLGLWSLPEAQQIPPWDWRHGGQVAGAPAAPVSAAPTTVKAPDSGPAASGFTCGAKRYCREMASCAEAIFYMKECGLTRLDGDNDGVPCEEMCN